MLVCYIGNMALLLGIPWYTGLYWEKKERTKKVHQIHFSICYAQENYKAPTFESRELVGQKAKLTADTLMLNNIIRYNLECDSLNIRKELITEIWEHRTVNTFTLGIPRTNLEKAPPHQLLYNSYMNGIITYHMLSLSW